MSFVVEVDRRLRIRQGLSSPVRARHGRPLLEPGPAVELTVTVGVAFEDDQLDRLGRYFDTDAAAEQVDQACADLAAHVWTDLFDFRPTFELVARHLFERLASDVPQLAFVRLHDETFGSRTCYRPRFSRLQGTGWDGILAGPLSRLRGPGWPKR